MSPGAGVAARIHSESDSVMPSSSMVSGAGESVLKNTTNGRDLLFSGAGDEAGVLSESDSVTLSSSMVSGVGEPISQNALMTLTYLLV